MTLADAPFLTPQGPPHAQAHRWPTIRPTITNRRRKTQANSSSTILTLNRPIDRPLGLPFRLLSLLANLILLIAFCRPYPLPLSKRWVSCYQADAPPSFIVDLPCSIPLFNHQHGDNHQQAHDISMAFALHLSYFVFMTHFLNFPFCPLSRIHSRYV